MFTISVEDIKKAKDKLQEANGGKGPESGTPLQALIESIAHEPYIEGLAMLALMQGAMTGNTHAVDHAIALGVVLGFQAGLTRAVDEPVKALIESVSVPTGAA